MNVYHSLWPRLVEAIEGWAPESGKSRIKDLSFDVFQSAYKFHQAHGWGQVEAKAWRRNEK